MTQQPKRTGSVRRAEQRKERIDFDPERPGSFDLGAFIASATLPEDKRPQLSTIRTLQVTVHPDIATELANLYEQADELEQRIAMAKEAVADPDGPKGPRRRLGTKSDRTAELDQVRERIKEIEDALDGTWLDIRLRGLVPSEQDVIRALKLPVGVKLQAAILSICAKVRQADGNDDVPDDDPSWGTLTADEWEQLIDRLGPVQTAYIDQAYAALTFHKVTPDFYGRFSVSRGTRNTSAS